MRFAAGGLGTSEMAAGEVAAGAVLSLRLKTLWHA